MKCAYPKVNRKNIKGTEYEYQYPCGKCEACRRTKQSQVKLRLLLELTLHANAAFITLTYNDVFLPEELKKDDAQRFLKRLRKQIAKKYGPKTPIKHYLVGEYGARTGRPHFHAILFGYPYEDIESLEVAWRRNIGSKRAPRYASLGFIQSRPVTAARAGYLVKYTTKFLESAAGDTGDHCAEFALMSKRSGGIGLGYLYALTRAIKRARDTQKPKLKLAEYFDTYVGSINVGSSRMSIDPYLRLKIWKYLHQCDGPEYETEEAGARRDRIAERRKAMIQSRRVPITVEQHLLESEKARKAQLVAQRKQRVTKKQIKT